MSRGLALEAERLRVLARQVARAGEVEWRSPTAALFRAEVGARTDGLRCRADQLESAARLVSAHAEAVEGARAEVLRVAALGAALPEAAGGALRATWGGR